MRRGRSRRGQPPPPFLISPSPFARPAPVVAEGAALGKGSSFPPGASSSCYRLPAFRGTGTVVGE
eukprot:14503996-Alexandrium_andersonii.AAC.1